MAISTVFGAEPIWHSDITKATRKLLGHRHPGLPNHGDITGIDWNAVEAPDILAGGFPCQDVSSAGFRRGLNGTTRTGLWSRMAEAIDILRPKLVIFENVRGLLNVASVRPLDGHDLGNRDTARGSATPRAFGVVLGDLAALGYDCRWLGLPASAVGAPHRRFRVFGLAWRNPADPAGLQLQRRRERPEMVQPPRPTGLPATVDRGEDGTPVWRRPLQDSFDRWESIIGRPPPDYRASNKNGRVCTNARWVEWLMGLPDGWVTDVPGMSRTMALHMLGNGVVPLQATAALDILASPELLGAAGLPAPGVRPAA
ncbi:DNA cytosine methyltransferase [Crossiella sp. SN42]|nr:DNA cytosine methyltransferase [Crossiella sp. SN42]